MLVGTSNYCAITLITFSMLPQCKIQHLLFKNDMKHNKMLILTALGLMVGVECYAYGHDYSYQLQHWVSKLFMFMLDPLNCICDIFVFLKPLLIHASTVTKIQ